MTLRLARTTRPNPTKAFSIQPFGRRHLRDGTEFDFDALYTEVLGPSFTEFGLTLARSDRIYGQGDVADTAWHGIQEARVLIADFTLQRPNVAAEFLGGVLLGKKILVITQDPDDIPSDIAGHYRYTRYDRDFQSIQHLKAELRKEIPALLEQPSTEMSFVPLPGSGGTTPVPGVVTYVEKDFAMVLTDDGRRVVLAAADVDYRRIVTDMARKFPVGHRLNGAFEVDLADGATRYTLLSGETNPWPLLESECPPGTDIEGTVDNVIAGVGIFVHVGHGINGLVPEQKLGGRRVSIGDKVKVAVTALDIRRRRVDLRLNGVVTTSRGNTTNVRSNAPTMQASSASRFQPGQVFDAKVCKVALEGQGGYVLLAPDGGNKKVMLHCTAMSADLRADLNEGLIEVGEWYYVEVTHVDERQGKVLVKDRADLDADADSHESDAETATVQELNGTATELPAAEDAA